MRYRYILCGIKNEKDIISSYRLIGGNNIGKKRPGECIWRVHIPDDLILRKYNCDSYSTTDDNRTIEQLGYDVMCVIDGKLKVVPKNTDSKAIEKEEFEKWNKKFWEKHWEKAKKK